MEHAARSAQDLAIRTNAGIVVGVVGVDGWLVELTATDLVKMHEKETAGD
jgi:hypothetical protein